MAKPVILTGVVELLGAIYSEENLPTAIVCPAHENYTPMCLHSLREGDETLFDKLVETEKHEIGEKTEPQFRLYRFFEDYPHRDHNCIGCGVNQEKGKNGTPHMIRHTERAASKLCADCP